MNMSMNENLSHQAALGLIETLGLVAAIEAADAMLKAAKVVLSGTEKSTGGLYTVKITGEVGAVRSALSAGTEAAKKVGTLVSSHIIPRPHEETAEMVFPETETAVPQKIVTSKKSTDFSKLPVRELRKLARSTENIGLSGREISSSNREALVKALKKH